MPYVNVGKEHSGDIELHYEDHGSKLMEHQQDKACG